MNTRMPMPPTQWLKLRQKSIPLFKSSTRVRMLEPVVVKPETVSNRASMYLGICPEIQKGTAPTRLITIQVRAAITKPSLGNRDRRLGFRRTIRPPSTPQRPTVMRKCSQVLSR